MKARTPIMANKTLFDGQLHSSGSKMIHFTKLDQVTFKQHLHRSWSINYSHYISWANDRKTNSHWLGTKEK